MNGKLFNSKILYPKGKLKFDFHTMTFCLSQLKIFSNSQIDPSCKLGRGVGASFQSADKHCAATSGRGVVLSYSMLHATGENWQFMKKTFNSRNSTGHINLLF
ncbi:hypothetical protein CHARACLAT_028755 [Characodon lateralis]|uniref:Uncharacterized protein n=1 Tax=Characodon lateralis TaxID=208331 RepID=A0ABU7EEC7_9TELE|nr:hypothetical protein [Characodon lateralis]